MFCSFKIKLLLLFGFSQTLVLASVDTLICLDWPPSPPSHYKISTYSTVTMPMGDNYIISQPSLGKGICSNESSLITMSPYDRKWNREYRIVKEQMEDTNGDQYMEFKILEIQKIFNSCLWRKYKYSRDQIYEDLKTTNERMLFHGSGVAKTMALNGFDERYAQNDGNFGAGLYFADRSSKSHEYTKEDANGTRQMLLCRVTLGKEYYKKSLQSFSHGPVGYQSVVGFFSTNDREYIVYRGEQVYPAYLITYEASWPSTTKFTGGGDTTRTKGTTET